MAHNNTNVGIEKRKRKTGTFYRLVWREAGAKKTLSCGSDHKLARSKAAEIRDRLRRGLCGERERVAWSEFVGELPTLMAGKARYTVTQTVRTCKMVSATWVDEVDRGLVLRFKAARVAAGKADATVNRELRQIKSALSYAVDAGYAESNPMLRHKVFIKEAQKVVRIVSRAELDAVVDLAEPLVGSLLVLGYWTGLRRGELTHLRWDHVDLDAGLLTVANTDSWKTKSRYNRTVPLVPEALDVLRTLWASASSVRVFPVRSAWVTRRLAALVERAGVAPWTLHDLRRTWATMLINRGVDRSLVKDLGGWSSVSVIERFYQGDVAAVGHAAMLRALTG